MKSEAEEKLLWKKLHGKRVKMSLKRSNWACIALNKSMIATGFRYIEYSKIFYRIFRVLANF